jgi:hypothetical protein
VSLAKCKEWKWSILQVEFWELVTSWSQASQIFPIILLQLPRFPSLSLIETTLYTSTSMKNTFPSIIPTQFHELLRRPKIISEKKYVSHSTSPPRFILSKPLPKRLRQETTCPVWRLLLFHLDKSSAFSLASQFLFGSVASCL